jgi:hypothetical protein
VSVNHNQPEVLAALLDLGFAPDERRRLHLDPPEDIWGQPLHNCAEYGKLEMARCCWSTVTIQMQASTPAERHCTWRMEG